MVFKDITTLAKTNENRSLTMAALAKNNA